MPVGPFLHFLADEAGADAMPVDADFDFARWRAKIFSLIFGDAPAPPFLRRRRRLLISFRAAGAMPPQFSLIDFAASLVASLMPECH